MEEDASTYAVASGSEDGDDAGDTEADEDDYYNRRMFGIEQALPVPEMSPEEFASGMQDDGKTMGMHGVACTACHAAHGASSAAPNIICANLYSV